MNDTHILYIRWANLRHLVCAVLHFQLYSQPSTEKLVLKKIYIYISAVIRAVVGSSSGYVFVFHNNYYSLSSWKLWHSTLKIKVQKLSLESGAVSFCRIEPSSPAPQTYTPGDNANFQSHSKVNANKYKHAIQIFVYVWICEHENERIFRLKLLASLQPVWRV